MNTNTHQGTAKIYQFAAHTRRLTEAQRGSAERTAESMPQHICDALDNCWYHDDAVQQATRLLKS